MMLGDFNPTVPPWTTLFDESTAGMLYPHPVSGISSNTLTALQRYLLSNDANSDDPDSDDSDLPVDAFSCDEFRMYEFKVRRCARGRSHDWTECPYAHPGEKARRRDPRKFHYSGNPCPDFRKGSCKRGEACEYAHGVFECWLHPSRYRTQPCKDGVSCRRRVCFFAHTLEQLRILSNENHSTNSSDSFFSSLSSTRISPPLSPSSDSPPLSPISSSIRRQIPTNHVLESLRKLQLQKSQSIPASWGRQVVDVAPVTTLFRSLPSTPTVTANTRSRWLEVLERDCCVDEEEPMERVESGKDLRAKIFEKLSRENLTERNTVTAVMPEVGWISDLLK